MEAIAPRTCASTGELGEPELKSGYRHAIAFCPGFARGLAQFGISLGTAYPETSGRLPRRG